LVFPFIFLPPPCSTLFPYTTLFRSLFALLVVPSFYYHLSLYLLSTMYSHTCCRFTCLLHAFDIPYFVSVFLQINPLVLFEMRILYPPLTGSKPPTSSIRGKRSEISGG